MDIIETENSEVIQSDEPTQQTQTEQTQEGIIDLNQATAEDLEQFDTYEDFLASQQAKQETTETKVEEPTQTEESTEQTSGEQTDDNQSEDTDIKQSDELTDAEFRQLITSNLRANHKDYQFTNPDEIRKLMSFGMNYHKKMNELAPHRKALKTLEQHGLLDPTKLGYAIELLNGDKKAIANLLKEHSVDAYDLPDLEESPYQAGDYLPTDSRVKFDETVAELQTSKAGQTVLEYAKNLDSASFSEIYDDPTMLETLSNHVDSGLFEDTLTFLEKERALGKVPANIKDIDAYAHVAQYLEKINPTKYLPQQPKPKILGSNRQVNTVNKTTHSKQSASIPNNTQVQRQETYSGIDKLINATEEELAKYDSWEQYLQANNLNFQR